MRKVPNESHGPLPHRSVLGTPETGCIRSYLFFLVYIKNDRQGRVSDSGDDPVAENKSIFCSFVMLTLFYKQTPVFVLNYNFVLSNNAINDCSCFAERLRQADGSR